MSNPVLKFQREDNTGSQKADPYSQGICWHTECLPHLQPEPRIGSGQSEKGMSWEGLCQTKEVPNVVKAPSPQSPSKLVMLLHIMSVVPTHNFFYHRACSVAKIQNGISSPAQFFLGADLRIFPQQQSKDLGQGNGCKQGIRHWRQN